LHIWQVLDVGAGGFGDPQPVQGEQRDQRMIAWRAEPGGDEQRAELIAIQRDGVRLVIDSGPSHVGGGRAVQELFWSSGTSQPG
jgi:hypothetical protein